ncbi:MAG TPA: hypothetical protein DCS09_11090 [Porphyromonadaceae bacterium]|nr:hypothetical protein [Porphyromonadaceae bacterium]
MADNALVGEDTKRYRVKGFGESLYFTFTGDSIMAHYANESAYENKDFKALLNFNNRILSKALSGEPLTWEIVATQAEHSTVGHAVITDDIAKAIRKNYGIEK